MIVSRTRLFWTACFLALIAPAAEGQTAKTDADPSRLSIDRIYRGNEFQSESVTARWLEGSDSATYTTIERSDSISGGQDIVRHDAADGSKKVMVSAAELIPAGQTKPLQVEDHSWSRDHNRLLIYTNSKRVWRRNTRGDYWVLDRSARQLRKIGGDGPPSSMMFAKFSPSGKQVAFVRERDIFVEDLFDQSVRPLTQAENDNVINGTTDWVYEEEFGLRDGFRWSPDGRSIAYWQIDTSGVQQFPLINHTDSLYPTVRWFAYPKVGQRNSSCRVGVVDLASSKTRWATLPGDSREHYVPRISFLPKIEADPGQNRLLLQQLNRLQNTNRLFLADLGSGIVSEVLAETDDAWVDVHDENRWISEGRRFTWVSDRDGWRHVYVAKLDDGELSLITPGEFDVVEMLHVDEDSGRVFFIASPDSASERYLYQASLSGGDVRRLTPSGKVGSHSYKISPDGNWAIHTYSSADHVPTTDLVTLPAHESVRMLQSNAKLAEKVAKLDRSPVEFLRVDIGEAELEGWCIKPPNFDETKKYPLLIYVYGEPAGTTVVNRWGGTSQLWHMMLAQQGYVVMSFDNRGTKSPRGRAWRKSIYQKIGILPPKDQAAAVQSVLKERNYLDADRVGIWGWSGGGSSSLQAIFKYPKLYHTAIAVAPVPNQRYYDTIYQERYMSLPELNVEGFREGSPINFAHQLEGNLMLIHGTGDDNCHYQTTEMLIDELIAHNKQFTMMAYPNRTHSIRERTNTTRHLRQLMTDYLHTHLPTE